jgi:hypothetical protein
MAAVDAFMRPRRHLVGHLLALWRFGLLPIAAGKAEREEQNDQPQGQLH